MFNPNVAKERFGPLKKSKNLNQLEKVEKYALRAIKEHRIETSYDVIAEEFYYFKTLGYTEYGSNFLFQPLNLKLRDEQSIDGFYDDIEEINDWSVFLKSNIEGKMANKYQDRKQDFSVEPRENLVVLPGSNKLKETVCLNKLKHIKKLHKDNLIFKPHPITTHAVIGELKDMFGADNVLDRDTDVYHYMQHAQKVYSTHISESALYATVLDKETEPIDVMNIQHRGSFYTINRHLFDRQKEEGRLWINKTFSSPKSGIINPSVDADWEGKVDQYVKYITEKRNKYKDWYIGK